MGIATWRVLKTMLTIPPCYLWCAFHVCCRTPPKVIPVHDAKRLATLVALGVCSLAVIVTALVFSRISVFKCWSNPVRWSFLVFLQSTGGGKRIGLLDDFFNFVVFLLCWCDVCVLRVFNIVSGCCFFRLQSWRCASGGLASSISVSTRAWNERQIATHVEFFESPQKQVGAVVVKLKDHFLPARWGSGDRPAEDYRSDVR